MSNTAANPPNTLVAQLEAAQVKLGLTDQQLSDALGFESPVVLTMIKAGAIYFPIPKIRALATTLDLNAADLVRLALRESMPEFSEIILDAFNTLSLSTTEIALIKHVRKLSGGQQGAPIVFGGKGVIALVVV